MNQLSFAQAEYATKRKVTRRERFLGEMERIVPWAALIAALAPFYFPDAGEGRGRRPIGLERMLRMYFLQQWYALADEALEDAIYDSQALRNFLGIDLSRESVPDATTLLQFRHLLEGNGLTRSVAVLRMRNGTSQSPFRLALGDRLFVPRFAPLRGHGCGIQRLRHDPYDEWLDGVSDALCMRPPPAQGHSPWSTPAARPRLRLPGTTRLRFALPGGQRESIFETVNGQLRERGLLLNKGTRTDATILAAPSSTKNTAKARDPEMHQTRKGNQWYFGMKAHIGADADSGLVHSLTGTAANVADVSQTEHLLHGEEQVVFADAGYIGADQREALKDKPLKWRIAIKRGKLKAMAEGPLKDLTRRIERLKAQLRSRVEHPFHVIKNLFGHRKVRYKGLAKNTAQLHTLFALANLVIAKKALLDHRSQGAS